MDALQRLSQPFCKSRRSRLVGLPCSIAAAGSGARRMRSASAARVWMLSGVSSYNCCATGAGPRWWLKPLTTNSRCTRPWRSCSRSPTRISRAGFTSWPLTCTRPRLTSSLASERVLYRRAAHSHLSMRTGAGLRLAVALVFEIGFPRCGVGLRAGLAGWQTIDPLLGGPARCARR